MMILLARREVEYTISHDSLEDPARLAPDFSRLDWHVRCVHMLSDIDLDRKLVLLLDLVRISCLP